MQRQHSGLHVYVRGAAVYLHTKVSQDLHRQIVHSLTLSFYKPLLFWGLEERGKIMTNTMEHNYWLHRSSYEYRLSQVLLAEKNLLSIGFSDFSNTNYLNKFLNSSQEEFDKIFKDKWDWVPKSRFSLWYFLREMKQGDYVLVPTPYYFSIYKIVGETPLSNESLDTNGLHDVWNNPVLLKDGGLYIKEEIEKIDLGFYWQVEPVCLNIPRANYADQALISRMKVRQTTLNISDLADDIIEAINAFENNMPICLHDLILQQTADACLQLIHDKISADKFEYLVKWYMEKLGATVEVPAKNSTSTEEGDADVIAYFEPVKLVILIQVKKHQGNTDSWAVEQISNYKKNKNMGDYTSLLWIISTCDDFTQETKEKALAEQVRLINGRLFTEMLLETGLKGLDI